MKKRYLHVGCGDNILPKPFENLDIREFDGVDHISKAEDLSLFEDDTFDFIDLNEFTMGRPLTLSLNHLDGSKDTIICNHTYNEMQIKWFKAGSALNLIRQQL